MATVIQPPVPEQALEIFGQFGLSSLIEISLHRLQVEIRPAETREGCLVIIKTLRGLEEAKQLFP